MPKYATTKFGTKINVEGLSPEQVKKVLSTAQDKGAYGGKGAALAASLQKKAKTPPPTGGPLTMGDAGQTVQVNPQLEIGGGTITAKAPEGIDLSGAPQVGGGRQYMGEARDAAFNYLTKDYAAQKEQELETAKQDLANRGIPFDPDPNSLYGRTLSQIGKTYQGMYDQASNQAITAGAQTLGAYTGADTAASDAFLSGAGLKDTSEQNLYRTNLDAILADKNLSFQEKQLAQQKLLAQQQNKTSLKIAGMNRGGGGGGGAAPEDTSAIIGGLAPGFGVSNG